jgi:hypothetical protein
MPSPTPGPPRPPWHFFFVASPTFLSLKPSPMFAPDGTAHFLIQQELFSFDGNYSFTIRSQTVPISHFAHFILPGKCCLNCGFRRTIQGLASTNIMHVREGKPRLFAGIQISMLCCKLADDFSYFGNNSKIIIICVYF